MSSQTNGRYEGRFAAPKRKPVRRITGGVLALLILLLSLARLGTEAFKLLTYADVFIGGGRLLIYGSVDRVDLGDTLTGKDKTLHILDGLPDVIPDDAVIRIDDGTIIIYNGHTYELNRDLTTILLLGIDQDIHETEIIGTGGQSDVVLLLGIDTKTGRTTVLNISRETYAEVDVYSVSGINTGTEQLQLTLAYAYGDGKHTSCQNAMRSVSRLLYGLPISSYLAVDIPGILKLNDAVGGVRLRSLEDMEMPDGSYIREGQLVELHGNNLDRYLRNRPAGLESNAKRMERQEQYITEFSKIVVSKSKDDLSFPVELFSTIAPYVVTDLDIPDITFLSTTFLTHGAEFSLRDIDGTSGMLGKSVVFYPDEVDLFEAVLEVFYNQVD